MVVFELVEKLKNAPPVATRGDYFVVDVQKVRWCLESSVNPPQQDNGDKPHPNVISLERFAAAPTTMRFDLLVHLSAG